MKKMQLSIGEVEVKHKEYKDILTRDGSEGKIFVPVIPHFALRYTTPEDILKHAFIRIAGIDVPLSQKALDNMEIEPSELRLASAYLSYRDQLHRDKLDAPEEEIMEIAEGTLADKLYVKGSPYQVLLAHASPLETEDEEAVTDVSDADLMDDNEPLTAKRFKAMVESMETKPAYLKKPIKDLSDAELADYEAHLYDSAFKQEAQALKEEREAEAKAIMAETDDSLEDNE